ncbi:MAG: GNAT family N-acetyltransferase [Deltaproteobacteria bacterium]|jgi:ribosomal protein S18 acetylase RimI-like enzyme|nr:GNAT family N-acetyltransferase [Deltaproteobacteria bacterium]
MVNKLPPEFRFVELSNSDFQKYWSDWGPKIFDDESTNLDTRKILSDEEKLHLKNLSVHTANLIRLNLGIFRGEEFCGWFTGGQQDYETFYMRNSAILPDFRGQGLYTALMYEVLERARKMGFQIVSSRHTTTNNLIIVPKLKAGFVISAIEVSERFGTLVHLKYFFNQTRKKVMVFRAGDLKPDTQLRNALGIE